KSEKGRRRAVHRQREKAPGPLPRKATLRENQKSQCGPRQVKRASRWMKKFARAPTSFPNAGADSPCLATPTRIGWKPSANFSLKSARADADVKAGVSPAIARL